MREHAPAARPRLGRGRGGGPTGSATRPLPPTGGGDSTPTSILPHPGGGEPSVASVACRPRPRPGTTLSLPKGCRSRGAAPHCRTIPPATKGTPRHQVAQPLPRRPPPLLHGHGLRLAAPSQRQGNRDPVPGMGRCALRPRRESAGICRYAGALPRSPLVRERRKHMQVPAENPRANLRDIPAGRRVLEGKAARSARALGEDAQDKRGLPTRESGPQESHVAQPPPAVQTGSTPVTANWCSVRPVRLSTVMIGRGYRYETTPNAAAEPASGGLASAALRQAQGHPRAGPGTARYRSNKSPTLRPPFSRTSVSRRDCESVTRDPVERLSGGSIVQEREYAVFRNPARMFRQFGFFPATMVRRPPNSWTVLISVFHKFASQQSPCL